MALTVLTPGVLTTVQDLGRRGARRFGVPLAGALDPRSLRAANALVGNDPGAAALELTLRGPVLRFRTGTTFAITGAGFAARLDGRPRALWRAHPARPGQELDCGSCTPGLRGYLAVRGGIDVPLVLGSRSTCLRGGFGGLEGRVLREGDELKIGGAPAAPPAEDAWRPHLGEPVRLRVRPGPHARLLSAADRTQLTTAAFRLRPDSDRMGARLEGPRLESGRPEVLTLPTLPGAVQLTPAGQVIVLLNDAQTTGGYPLVGMVVEDDLGDLAQARPGAAVYFGSVRRGGKNPPARSRPYSAEPGPRLGEGRTRHSRRPPTSGV